MVTGTNGSQLWDLSFTMQFLVETGLANDKANRDSVLKGLGWLDRCQIQQNPPVRWPNASTFQKYKGAHASKTIAVPRKGTSAYYQGCMAVQHQRTGVYRQRLYGRSDESRPLPPTRARVRPCSLRLQNVRSYQKAQLHARSRVETPALRLCRRHLVASEPWRRVRELRTDQGKGMAGVAQPGRSIWEHHDRVRTHGTSTGRMTD